MYPCWAHPTLVHLPPLPPIKSTQLLTHDEIQAAHEWFMHIVPHVIEVVLRVYKTHKDLIPHHHRTE